MSIEDLSEYYAELIESSSPPGPRTRSANRSQSNRLLAGVQDRLLHPPPLISPHFDKFPLANGEMARLVYKERLMKEWEDKSVFRAEATISSVVVQVVVKFTRSYCREAHELLADASLAPALRYCAHERDVRMYVVVMDYVERAETWERLSPARAESLRKAVRLLHEKDIVFGDLRAPNVLGLEDRIMVIDFDWAGQMGSARYPEDISMGKNGISWPKGVKRGGLIEKEHDLDLMERVIAGQV